MRAEFIFEPVHNVMMVVNFHNTPLAGQRVPAKRIIRLCAEEFHIPINQLCEKREKRSPHWLCHARFAAWDLLRRHTALSYYSIGQRFGGRDHSSVLVGVRRSGQLLADPDETRYTEAFERVRERLLV